MFFRLTDSKLVLAQRPGVHVVRHVHIPPLAVGAFVSALGSFYLAIYPTIVIDSMWANGGAFSDEMQCSAWGDVPAEVVENTPHRGNRARECRLRTPFYDFHFWQVELSDTEEPRKVPLGVTWRIRPAQVAAAALATLAVWGAASIAWSYFAPRVIDALYKS